MPSIEILDTGRIDERDSAFPQAVQLPNGDILCSFNVGGGAHVTGGTDWARSTDGGQTWNVEGTLVPRVGNATSALKLSISADGKTVYAYGSRSYREEGGRFGEGRNEPIFCTSTDGGHTWSEPTVVPMMGFSPLEISHGALALQSGRLLAPGATLESQDKLGRLVIAAVSDDGGQSWPRHATVFEDPDGVHGYFEQKLAESLPRAGHGVEPGLLISTCWTIVMDGVKDIDDHFTISRDDGLTWSRPKPTGIMGQTMTPIPLGGDRLLVLYNRRYGQQGVIMNLVTFTDDTWDGPLRRVDVRPQHDRRASGGHRVGRGDLLRLPIRLPDCHQAARWHVSGDSLVTRRRPLRHQVDAPASRLVTGHSPRGLSTLSRCFLG